MVDKSKGKQVKAEPKKTKPQATVQGKQTAATKKRATFRLNAPEAGEVCLAGSFNSWDPSSRPLKRDQKGVWTATLMLAPGVYEYRLVVDGQWCDDPNAAERRPNEHGTYNCVVTIVA